MLYRLRYLAELDGLRAIAVLAVMVGHADRTVFHGHGFAVDVFFVLSGYLITTLLLQEWHSTDGINLRQFYGRRFLRLMPAYVALCLAYVGFRLAGHAVLTGGWAPLGYAVTYTMNWAQAWRGPGWTGLLGPTWSLSIEEQFYFLWPLLLLVLLRRKVSRPWLMAVPAVLAVCSVLARVWIATHANGAAYGARLYYGSDTRADGLFLGCFLAMWLAWRGLPENPARSRWLAVGGVAGTAGLALLIAGWQYGTPLITQQGFGIANLCTVAVLLYILHSPKALAVQALKWGPLVWVGRVSYGLYLWHFPLFLGTEHLNYPAWWFQPARFLGAFALAAASYRFIEQPFLKMKKKLRTEE